MFGVDFFDRFPKKNLFHQKERVILNWLNFWTFHHQKVVCVPSHGMVCTWIIVNVFGIIVLGFLLIEFSAGNKNIFRPFTLILLFLDLSLSYLSCFGSKRPTSTEKRQGPRLLMRAVLRKDILPQTATLHRHQPA